jgi:hypothetical protein
MMSGFFVQRRERQSGTGAGERLLFGNAGINSKRKTP